MKGLIQRADSHRQGSLLIATSFVM